MFKTTVFKKLSVLAISCLVWTFPLGNGSAVAQQNSEAIENSFNVVQFHKLSLQKLIAVSRQDDFSKPEELELSPLSQVEENIARDLNSHWAWPEHTLEMIDSYSPFLFRTKKSQDLSEVKILLDVNAKGRVSGFEVVGNVDKGTKERLDHMIRKLPNCKPVPGYSIYSPERFELTINK
ncbi:hypothetical protein [Algoriphagus sp.]|uniref:hypothetical protein n=1 Tax=Algoriphagus sp. TaxID=1872435 RepID=UPI00391A0E9A